MSRLNYSFTFSCFIYLFWKNQNWDAPILTDRNDLDDQLFNTFAYCSDLLRQNPVQAQDREHLTELLQVSSGGVVFTTIQKFALIGIIPMTTKEP
ncbi:hypothetical protein [Nostoc sp.]|uniref:hypothetical protein n=1 Tax=Nostoc sp. TaxID=1180 RepID=UPI002FFA2C9F